MLLSDRIKPGRIVFRNRVFEPDEIVAGTDHLARYFADRVPRDRPFIYLISTNHVKFIIAYFAIIKSGHVCVLVDPAIGRIEFEEMILDSPPAAIVRIAAETISFDYSREIQLFRTAARFSEQLSNVCTMVYTAGESGYLKAAMLTSSNLIENAEICSYHNRLDNQSCSCAIIPFHHVYGLQSGVLIPFAVGGTSIIVDPSMLNRMADLLGCMCEWAVTHVCSVPLFYYLLYKSPLAVRLSATVKSFVSGGCPLSEELHSKCLRRQLEIREGYGLTEMSGACSFFSNDRPKSRGSVGRALRSCQIGVADGTGAAVHCGEGEICVAGKTLMKGYYRHPETSSDGGWFRTGDIGIVDNQGFVTLTGLKKRMINRGGNKIYARHLERHLEIHPSIEKAEISEVAGTPVLLIPRTRATIWLSKADTRKTEILDWCKGNVTAHRIPDEFVIGDPHSA